MTTRQQVSTYVAVAIVFFAASMIIDRVEWKKRNVKPTPTVTANVTPTNEVVFGPDGLPLPLPPAESGAERASITFPGPEKKPVPFVQLSEIVQIFKEVSGRKIKPNHDWMDYSFSVAFQDVDMAGLISYKTKLYTDKDGKIHLASTDIYLYYAGGEWKVEKRQHKFLNEDDGWGEWVTDSSPGEWNSIIASYYDR